MRRALPELEFGREAAKDAYLRHNRSRNGHGWSRILDVKGGRYIENAGILIEGDRIKEIGPVGDVQTHATKSATVINLGSATLLPGLVDCHTHLMARIPRGPDGYIVNLATKSQAFRALEGAADARATTSTMTEATTAITTETISAEIGGTRRREDLEAQKIVLSRAKDRQLASELSEGCRFLYGKIAGNSRWLAFLTLEPDCSHNTRSNQEGTVFFLFIH